MVALAARAPSIPYVGMSADAVRTSACATWLHGFHTNSVGRRQECVRHVVAWVHSRPSAPLADGMSPLQVTACHPRR
jgi:hypothetical protein